MTCTPSREVCHSTSRLIILCVTSHLTPAQIKATAPLAAKDAGEESLQR
ncbi:hypothetical protein E2C01_076360 [Portunus trituberculatus]|uniref:Uncharacterized protein n=1 Tax=Portunus trituberculatus TaxID=210409 RepID=A0A5B7IIQ0_PORTR|nr:hypothetical protein [Portunus trituberculatus]